MRFVKKRTNDGPHTCCRCGAEINDSISLYTLFALCVYIRFVKSVGCCRQRRRAIWTFFFSSIFHHLIWLSLHVFWVVAFARDSIQDRNVLTTSAENYFSRFDFISSTPFVICPMIDNDVRRTHMGSSQSLATCTQFPCARSSNPQPSLVCLRKTKSKEFCVTRCRFEKFSVFDWIFSVKECWSIDMLKSLWSFRVKVGASGRHTCEYECVTSVGLHCGNSVFRTNNR